MTCDLLDIPCHLTTGLWSWFASWPLFAHILLLTSVLLVAWVLLDKIVGVFKRLAAWGGWRAMAGVALGIAAFVVALWPSKRSKPVRTEDQYRHPDPRVTIPTKRPKGVTAADEWERRK